MVMVAVATEDVKQVKFAAVKCPNCTRYLGAFVGKAQCKSCSRWITVDKESVTD